MVPKGFSRISPSTISPNRHARSRVQMVTKYALHGKCKGTARRAPYTRRMERRWCLSGSDLICPYSPLALALGGQRGRDESRPYNSPLNALSRMEGSRASSSAAVSACSRLSASICACNASR
jgi:hypothetical protein